MTNYSQSFVYCRVFLLLIIDYSTKKGVLVYSRNYASENVYFRSNPYIKQCELMCKQILLHYNFHVSLGDKTEKRYDLFAFESPRFESHADILSLSSVFFFYYYCETIYFLLFSADENLDL